MTYRYLTDLADTLRAAGLKVSEVDGWKSRGRPSSTGGFDPVGVLCHHTATSKASSNADVVRLLVNGRSDLPGPLAQLGLARDGTVYVVAAGRANHAGTAKASGTVAGGDGNSLYIGIEAFNDGVGEPWPAVQYDAYVKLCATLCEKVTGNSAATVRGHKETSVTGKIDPTFDMNAFRERVDAAMGDAPKPDLHEHGPVFTIAQVSGRFDASEDQWQTALERAAEATKTRDATIRIITETTRTGIPRNVKEPGVSMTRLSDEPGQDEITILWDRDVWEKASEPYAVRLTETSWRTGTGHTIPPRWATVQPLRHKASGRIALVAGFHAPNDDSTRQRAAHAELMDALDGVWDTGRERHPDAVRVIGFDLNLDMREKAVRDLWAAHAPKLILCWNEDTLPDRGTIGKVRVIDGVAHGVGLDLAADPTVLDLVGEFDHRIVIVPLQWDKP